MYAVKKARKDRFLGSEISSTSQTNYIADFHDVPYIHLWFSALFLSCFNSSSLPSLVSSFLGLKNQWRRPKSNRNQLPGILFLSSCSHFLLGLGFEVLESGFCLAFLFLDLLKWVFLLFTLSAAVLVVLFGFSLFCVLGFCFCMMGCWLFWDSHLGEWMSLLLMWVFIKFVIITKSLNLFFFFRALLIVVLHWLC